jgi:hypothetical protein
MAYVGTYYALALCWPFTLTNYFLSHFCAGARMCMHPALVQSCLPCCQAGQQQQRIIRVITAVAVDASPICDLTGLFELALQTL